MTHKTTVEFIGEATIAAGVLIDPKKHFTEKEIESFEDEGYLKKIEIPEIEETPKKAEKAEIVILEDMTQEQMVAYAGELGITLTEPENEDMTFTQIFEFDYSDLNAGPLKNFALVLGADLKGLTKMDQYKEAIEKVKTQYLEEGDGEE